MEIQRVPGLDFEELGLVSGIVIPPKFKVPLFSKYDGVSWPKMHLRSYVRKIQPHSADKDLWVQFFQDNLSGMQLDWFYQLERSDVHNWEDLADAFYKQYQYNTDLAPTRTQLEFGHGIKWRFQRVCPEMERLGGTSTTTSIWEVASRHVLGDYVRAFL